jgi:hypothetical protein
MKEFEEVIFDPAKCQRELAAFDKLLTSALPR